VCDPITKSNMMIDDLPVGEQDLEFTCLCILQIYTMAGRRSQLSMMLGSPAAFMDCNQQGWRLLLLTKEGSLYLWDLQESKLLLHESLSPLLSPSSVNENSKSNGM
jgi:protein HIRA/HIR1